MATRWAAMTTGEGIALVAGVGGVGLVGYLVLKRAPAAAAAPGVVNPAPAPRAVPAVQQLANGVQSISSSGCAAIASGKGVPSSLARTACNGFTKYLTPVGLTTVALNQVEKIPIVGGAVKSTVNAVSQVVSKPINAVEHFLGSLF